VRMKVVVPRAAVTMTAAVVLAGLAISGCGTNKLGAAAITGNSRISSATLTSQVANLNTADEAKGVKPQRATGQETQQVLTWLILFKIYDQVAAQHHINPTPAQAQAQLTGPNSLSSEAAQNKVTLTEYISAAGALPPDLKNQLGRYFAILAELQDKLDGGKAPAGTAAQTKLETQLGHEQCLAAKSLGVNVNPQYGQFDYGTYSVVPAPSKLSVNPSPSASASPAVLTPPC
jgi:hypothetical protein